MSISDYREKIYAGVLGKILGVYLGRPVEGWPYEKIRDRFGEIWYYKNHRTGAPLIVPDDDISGTFAFFRALRDNGYDADIKAEAIGDAWLNYIIENETILWWGGLCRSTEHTAYLRLKNGIRAPKSGSMELNGQSMAEQIGAEIFIDAFAMANPGNPERAAKMAREAASVSHDGIAVDAAVYLAVLEAMAFEERGIDTLLDRGLDYVDNGLFKALVADVRRHCAEASDWREVREWIAAEHGYEKYPGNCPMVTNHLVLLMSLILGGDSFHRACMIACSAGWDTDCNSGNVGALNGIRLGLPAFENGADLRRAVADRLYVVTSDGGSCVSDAVQEAREIYRAACALAGEAADKPAGSAGDASLTATPAGKAADKPAASAGAAAAIPAVRYAFEYPGSTQGFIPYDKDTEEQVLTDIRNTFEEDGTYGLKLSFAGLARGMHASASVDTFVDLKPKGVEGTSYFDVLCSPTLYATQTVSAEVESPFENGVALAFFIEYFDENDDLAVIAGEPQTLKKGANSLTFEVPDTAGHPIYRLGIRLTSDERIDGSVILRSLDFGGAPCAFAIGRSMDMTPSLTPWTTTTSWLKAFVSSADHWNPDYTVTFSISNAVKNGVVTTGTADWKDYSVRSKVTFSMQESAGLVARACGHRRYYGAVLSGGFARIYRQENEKRYIIAEERCNFKIDAEYELLFVVKGRKLTFFVDGIRAAEGNDTAYAGGQAGYVVDSGSILCDGFEVRAV